jgi:hypothetical protein
VRSGIIQQPLIIKESANFNAAWITSFALIIPILILIKFPNFILGVVFLMGAIFLYTKIYKEVSMKKPVLEMHGGYLTIKQKTLNYDEIEYFQFIGYKSDERRTIDLFWWTGKTIILELVTKQGQKIGEQIPNQLGNNILIKEKIREVLKEKMIKEKKEKMRK